MTRTQCKSGRRVPLVIIVGKKRASSLALARERVGLRDCELDDVVPLNRPCGGASCLVLRLGKLRCGRTGQDRTGQDRRGAGQTKDDTPWQKDGHETTSTTVRRRTKVTSDSGTSQSWQTAVVGRSACLLAAVCVGQALSLRRRTRTEPIRALSRAVLCSSLRRHRSDRWRGPAAPARLASP